MTATDTTDTTACTGRLAGKTVIISGAGQAPGLGIGNGRAMAVLFAREGADLVLVDRDEASVEATAVMLAASGTEAKTVVGDATDESTAAAAVAAALDGWGRVDVLVNNVGINDGDGSITAVSIDAWERIMRVNTRSVLLMTKAVLPAMRAQQSGSIVNISSAATRVSLALLAYKMSKAAVEQATTAVADGNARYGIRANSVLPGLIETPMGVDQQAADYGMSRDQWAELRNAKVPLKQQMGTAWDVAHAALYLASDDAKFVTGVHLTVDGGQSLRVG